ncbi:MAG: glucosamine-6-phosphate deaminase [Oscillospiraceae bacterium]|nr:glucosamine-6-phosphate deaminase [Oscillospiraceae bacterium]
MEIIRARDYDHMSRQAANLLSAQVILHPESVLGLATGSSPIGTYRQLIKWYEKGDVDFHGVRTVNLDEYVGLGAAHEQSYARFMRVNFFDHVNILPENTHIPDGTNPDEAYECARYDALIRGLGGVDMQLLGLGPNGHIGFNEPGDCFTKGTHKVELAEATIRANRRLFDDESQVPRFAYTMGILDIMQAERVVMVVSGEAKAEIVREAFFGPVTPRVPASILQLHRKFTLVADEAALSKC